MIFLHIYKKACMSTKKTKPVFKTDVDKRGGGGQFGRKFIIIKIQHLLNCDSI